MISNFQTCKKNFTLLRKTRPYTLLLSSGQVHASQEQTLGGKKEAKYCETLGMLYNVSDTLKAKIKKIDLEI